MPGVATHVINDMRQDDSPVSIKFKSSYILVAYKIN